MSTTIDERGPDQPRPRTQHREVVREAGIGRISGVSIIAGTLAAYGAFALVAAIAGAVLSAADEDTKFATNDWTSAGAVGAIATALVLFLAYLFGGYVAGRMARRSGVVHGAAVFLLGLVAAAVIGGVVAAVTDNADVERNLQSIGVPTTADQWGDVGAITAVAAVVLMAIGAVLGGLLGERWHTKLARRALDPDYGPDADARRQAAEERAQREQEERERIERERAEQAEQTEEAEHEQHDEVVRSRSDERLDADQNGSGRDTTESADADHVETDLTDDQEQRLSGREWAQQNHRDDEPRLSPAEWAEIERMQATRRARH